MDQIVVNYEGRPCYTIDLTNDFNHLSNMFHSLDTTNHKVCIVSDSTVAPLYLEKVKEILKDCVKEVISFTFPAGEQSKNLDVIYEIYDTLIQAKFDRKDLLVALGGGVVGDMTGFAAATYLRGIRFVQIPTTLLSMVDSSIGGKTGVDFKAYKNMVGAFHQPSAVYMNLTVLKTLTEEQYRSGIGEIVKHALIRNVEYYQWLIDHSTQVMDRDLAAVKDMVYESLLIKKAVVEKDPKELGERALLNFGHTLGHAIEKQMNFQMLHGDCVAVGIVCASYISYKRGHISLQELEGIKELLSTFTLPIHVDLKDTNAVIETTASDKKMEAGKIKFILLERIGTAIIDTTVTKEEMLEAISNCLS